MEETFKEWRQSLPESAMRMPWWRELKWLVASYLLEWVLRLVQDEISDKTALAFHAFAKSLADGNDPKFNTVKMRPVRR